MVELALVVAILASLSVIAYPTLRDVGQRDRATGVTAHTAHLLNQMKERARRRNRAHLVSFTTFSGNEAAGELRITESRSSSCRAAVDQEGNNDNLVVLASYGRTPAFAGERRYGLEKDENVGLLDVRPAEALANGRVFFCLKPDGALLNGHTLAPFPPMDGGDRGGAVEILLQRFTPSGRVAEPSRGILVPFAGPTRVRMETGA